MKIDFINPRHSYAPPLESGLPGHIYTNTSLWTAAAQFCTSGVDVIMHDENITKADITSDIVGINLLGSPYVPETIQLIQRIRNEVSKDIVFVLGGQVLANGPQGLTGIQFNYLFGDGVYNGMDPLVLKKLGIDFIQPAHATSLIPIYDKLSDDLFLQYFSQEVSLYVSQGCSQKCSFCAAVKATPEKYRDHNVVYDDLYYIVDRLTRLGRNCVSVYMSNLDVFQTPLELIQFVQSVENIKSRFPSFCFQLRGLAGVSYFIKLHNRYPDLIRRLADVGFDTVGYGVDGVGKEIRKGIKKPQNNEQNTLDAIRITREEYGITPELLMVFGHNGVDTADSLQEAYEFTEEMVQRYKAIPRPHVSKSFLPGNDGRVNPTYANQIAQLLQDPILFQALDFTALPSQLTHPDPSFRELATQAFLNMCALPGNTTIPILPIDIGQDYETRETIRQQNVGKYDR